MDADVIVVGAGLSGLVAAHELAEAGRSVIDASTASPCGSLGGQAYWSFGGLFLVDSPEQRRLRIHDSEELALADWLGSAAFDRPRGPLAAPVGRGVRALRVRREAAAGCTSLGVRWFPLVQWAERGGYTAPGHGNSVPRFHVTWGTGPGLVEPFARARAALPPGADPGAAQGDRDGGRRRRAYACPGTILEPSELPRGVTHPRTAIGEFSFSAQAVVVAGGGIGGNLDLVRRNWPLGWGQPPRTLIAGVPDYVDGSMLPVTEAAGGRVINADRMWHYPEGIMNHAPIWSHHGIRILPGPSSLWLDARGRRFPAPLFPGFDALGALRHVTSTGFSYSWFVLDQATLSAEFALSGSEQNADFTGKDLRLLAGRIRPGPTPEVRAFAERGVDFLTAGSVAELAAQMNQLAGMHLIEAGRTARHHRGPRPAGRTGLGKDPQVVATAAARKFIGDRLIRVVAPHELLDRQGRATAGPGRAGRWSPSGCTC